MPRTYDHEAVAGAAGFPHDVTEPPGCGSRYRPADQKEKERGNSTGTGAAFRTGGLLSMLRFVGRSCCPSGVPNCGRCFSPLLGASVALGAFRGSGLPRAAPAGQLSGHKPEMAGAASGEAELQETPGLRKSGSFEKGCFEKRAVSRRGFSTGPKLSRSSQEEPAREQVWQRCAGAARRSAAGRNRSQPETSLSRK